MSETLALMLKQQAERECEDAARGLRNALFAASWQRMCVLVLLNELTGAAPDRIRIRASQIVRAFMDEYSFPASPPDKGQTE